SDKRHKAAWRAPAVHEAIMASVLDLPNAFRRADPVLSAPPRLVRRAILVVPYQQQRRGAYHDPQRRRGWFSQITDGLRAPSLAFAKLKPHPCGFRCDQLRDLLLTLAR